MKVLWLRCNMCEIQYNAEIAEDELEEPLVERKSYVLDVCPHCQGYGRKLYIREYNLIDAGLLNG